VSSLQVRVRTFNSDLPSHSAAVSAAMAAHENKAEDIVILDMSGISIMADYFVICTVNTDTHARAVRQAVVEALEGTGMNLRGREGADASGWVLLDWGDVVVHVFEREQRDYYCLDKLWGNAPSRRLVESESGEPMLV
jgi:ribosome-associated protein